MLKLTMSRRNLETLLNKLNRNKECGDVSACTLMLPDDNNDTQYVEVHAVENKVKYGNRAAPPGGVYPLDDPGY